MELAQPAFVAIGIFAVYLLVVAVLWRVNDVDYTRIAESDTTVTRGILVPIGAGLALLVGATTVLGWWPDVLVQERTGSTWVLVVPALFALASAASCLHVDYRELGTRRVLVLAAGTLVVGMAEELLARGLLVVGAQQAGWSLVAVWLFSSVLFALLHAINALFGLPWRGMLGQLVLAFLGGTAFFVTLLSTGSLFASVVIHAAWDFGGLAHQASDRPLPWIAAAGIGVVYPVAVVAAWFTTVS